MEGSRPQLYLVTPFQNNNIENAEKDHQYLQELSTPALYQSLRDYTLFNTPNAMPDYNPKRLKCIGRFELY